jgi:predicted RNase H-like HicB family nuclease
VQAATVSDERAPSSVWQQILAYLRRLLQRLETDRDDDAETASFAFKVKLEEDELDGGWVAYCLDLPGCVSQGDTEEEALENLTDAIGGVLTVRMQTHVQDALESRTAEQSRTPHRAKSYRTALSA